jgi:translation initiation factor 2B subunit (eIF-2B alpha/beta/delta family)
MSSKAITTVVKMLESLPIDIQDRVAEHLREYISDLQDEARWEESFQRTQESLVAAARRAKQEIAEGQAKAMDYEQL